MLSVCLAPGAMAASSTGHNVYLYDNGGAGPNATTDWYAKVDQPMFILADGETDLVLDVSMFMHNGTGLASDGTYVVSVVISDGTTTLTETATIVTATATTAQLTFTAAELATLAVGSDATVTYTITLADVELDSYVWSDVTIDGHVATGSLLSIIPILISVLCLVLVFSMLGGVMGKLGGMFKRK